MPAARARYADYPYLLEAIETRHDRYNIQRMHLWKYEREGPCAVIAPQKPVEVGHVGARFGKALTCISRAVRRQSACLRKSKSSLRLTTANPSKLTTAIELEKNHGSWMTCAETLVGAKIPVDSYSERGNMDGLCRAP